MNTPNDPNNGSPQPNQADGWSPTEPNAAGTEPVSLGKEQPADPYSATVHADLPADAATTAHESQADAQYAQTQFGMPVAGPDPYAQNPYGQDPYGQPGYGTPPPADPYGQVYGQAAYGQPQYGQAQYGQPQYGQPQYGYPAPGQFVPFASPVGAPTAPQPSTAQTSAILGVTFSALLVVGCYTTLIGIVPLIFSILALTKANAVNRLWTGGQYETAQISAEESFKWARWTWYAMGIGFAVVILVVLVIVAIAAGNA